MPDAPPAPPAEATEAEAARVKRDADTELSLEDAQKLWKDLQDSGAAQGDEAAKLFELMGVAQMAKKSRAGDLPGGQPAPGQHV